MVTCEVLEPQGRQELQGLLRGGILTSDHGLMSLQTDRRMSVCVCLQVGRVCVQHLFKHEGELHAVSGDAVCVQEAVEFEVEPPAGAAFVGAS